MGQLVSPDKYEPLHPGYVVSVIVRRRFGWTLTMYGRNSH